MSPVVYLISGANRGIGLGIVQALANRGDVVIFAGARNPAGATELQALSLEFPDKVHVVKLTSSDKSDNEAAVAEVKRLAGKLDIVIANAGIFKSLTPILETSAEQLREHFDVNTVGVVTLFQAVYPLLKESPSPKFVPVSSGAGSISEGAPMPADMSPYGCSKAALNWFTRRLHFEFPDLIAFPINPGAVVTDMSNFTRANAETINDLKFLPVEESVRDLLNKIDIATRENSGGKFLDHTDRVWGW